MWKELRVGECVYFTMTTRQAQQIKCTLFDSKWLRCFCETLTSAACNQRVQQLNKRIQYDEQIVWDTLNKLDPAEAEARNWTETESSGDVLKLALKLKYRVHSRPFNFEWHMQELLEHEFHKIIIMPFLKTIQGMAQQLTELSETVRKKDIEIIQYKMEGAQLRRNTVATDRFDFAEFESRFENINKLSQGCQKFATYMLQQEEQELQHSTILDMQRPIKPESPIERQLTSKSPKISPRNRKRQVLAKKQLRLAEKLNAKKQKLVYESSQSQSQSQSEGRSGSFSPVPAPAAVSLKQDQPQKEQEQKLFNADADLDVKVSKCSVSIDCTQLDYFELSSKSKEANESEAHQLEQLEEAPFPSLLLEDDSDSPPVSPSPLSSIETLKRQGRRFSNKQRTTATATVDVVDSTPVKSIQTIMEELKKLEERRIADLEERTGSVIKKLRSRKRDLEI